MRRIVRRVLLGGLFLTALPVIGTQMSAKPAMPDVSIQGGASVHYKTSAWPRRETSHAVAEGVSAGRIAI